MYLDIFDHKDIPLYVVDLPYGFNQVHREYFTRIPWGEYKRIRFAERFNSISNFELKIKIFRDYTVRSPKWKDEELEILPAGIVDTISNLIMYVSDSGIIPDSEGNIDIEGFNYRLSMYRGIASTNVEYQMYTVICIVFRAYTFEMLDKLPFDRIASLFASAERYLLENGILKQPLQVYRPEEPKKETVVKVNSNKSLLEEFIEFQNKSKENKVDPEGEGEPAEEEYSFEQLLKEKEEQNKKLAEAQKSRQRTENVEYIPPKDDVVLSNGVAVRVPGIKIDRSETLGGFTQEDFATLPKMTDDEAIQMQIEMGLIPAGYDLYLQRKEREEKAAMGPAPDLKQNKFGKKKPFKRK